MNGTTDREIRMIVGLGNPGREYQKTRHNAGFEVTSALLSSLPGNFKQKEKYDSIYWEGRFRGRNITIQQPQTFMNLSGKAVAALAAKKAVTPAEIVVVYDDMDLPLGRLRIRRNGSSAGHRGVESIITEFGSSAFPRLRIGIGHAPEGTIDHVLSGFTADEEAIFGEVLKTCVDALTLSLVRGIGCAMDEFNGISREQDDNENNNNN
ncbi:MAG: aminoacyl-tRNA hydrolase [Victivallales bacterium]|nr:aminoacyl-tRNA hydrolase [Victivallales bacterium]